MRSLLLVLLAGLLALPVAAQQDFDGRVIAVTGSGEVRAPSNRAVLQIAFDTEGETAEDALRQHEVEVDRIVQILRERGVAEDQISVDHASVAPAGALDFAGLGGDGESSGYTVSRQMTVSVDDLGAVPGLVAALSTDRHDDALAVQERTVNVSYVLADAQALQRQALREAVADARARAELVAEMAGVTLGDVLDVSEGAASAGGGDMGVLGIILSEAMRRGMLDGGGGEHSVTASVVVTYRIR